MADRNRGEEPGATGMAAPAELDVETTGFEEEFTDKGAGYQRTKAEARRQRPEPCGGIRTN